VESPLTGISTLSLFCIFGIIRFLSVPVTLFEPTFLGSLVCLASWLPRGNTPVSRFRLLGFFSEVSEGRRKQDETELTIMDRAPSFYTHTYTEEATIQRLNTL
jgi:hypothetical protein